MTLSSSSPPSSSSSSPAEVTAPAPVVCSLEMGPDVSESEPDPYTKAEPEHSLGFHGSQDLHTLSTSHLPSTYGHLQPFHPLGPVHPLHSPHPLHPGQSFMEPVSRSPQAAYTGLAIHASSTDMHHEQGPQGLGMHTRYDPGYQPMEHSHPMFSRADYNGPSHRYSLPVFPQGGSRADNDPSSVFQSYMSTSDGPIIHHRNSIAGSTLPNTVVRARRAGSLAMVEDGPYFANTKQFHNLFNMDQTQSYKLRVMARIDRGFFTANKIWTCYRRNYFQVSTAFSILGFDHSQGSEVPCLMELKDSAPGHGVRSDSNFHGELNSPRDTNAMIGSLDGLRLNDHGESGTTTSRLIVVTDFSISITSKIASLDKKIDLVQHTPKRDKGPQIVPGLRSIRGGGTLTLTGTSTSQSVVTFERVQFKTATANNGKRRAAQQFYILMVDLYAHTEDGQVFCVASSQSDSLVVRGRSPGHYIDTPERDMMTSPGPSCNSERRLSNISQHSAHPYHVHYPGSHSRSHSISAGAGMSVDVSSFGLGLTGSGPFSPMSPGAANEYSPTTGPGQVLYHYPSHQGWTDASSMSSPSSTYDGSSFSSPTAAYPSMHQYQGQQSPQEHAHSSYFAQRQPSFGSITPRLMMGSTGVNPRHPFDSQLEPPQENNYEEEDSSNAHYQGYSGSSSGHPKLATAHQTFPRSSHSLPVGHGAVAVAGSFPDHPFVKTEAQEVYFPYSGSFTHPLNDSGNCPEPTPSSTSASSVSSSFGYPVHESAGVDGYPPSLPESRLHGGSYETSQYRSADSIPQYAHHGGSQGAPLYQHDQEHHEAIAWS